jgi:hypothetical protein
MGSQGFPGQPGKFGDPADFVRRLERIEANQRELGPSIAKSFQGTVAELQDVQNDQAELIASQVGVAGDTSSPTDFSLSSGSWVTVATVTLSRPDWAVNAVVTAAGSLFLVANTAFAVPSLRLVVDGTSSMEVELPEGTGASAIPYYGTQTFTRSIAAVGATVTCTLQAFVVAASAWYTGAANRKAQLSSTAVFTR